MKTITNTLLIAAIFTSNIVASQTGCRGKACLAVFSKHTSQKTTVPTFKSKPMNTFIQIEYIMEQPTHKTNTNNRSNDNAIVTVEKYNDETIEIVGGESILPSETLSNLEGDTPVMLTMPSETPSNLVEEQNIIVSIETNIEQKLIIEEESTCKEGNEIISCDSADASKCTC